METAILTLLGYLGGHISNSKGTSNAKNELSTAIWEWIRPLFLKDDSAVKDFKEEPQDEDNIDELKVKLKKKIKGHSDLEKELHAFVEKITRDESGLTVTKSFLAQHYGTGDIVGGDKIGRDKISGNTININRP